MRHVRSIDDPDRRAQDDAATWDGWAEHRILDGGRREARGAMRHGEAHPQTIASVARYPSVL